MSTVFSLTPSYPVHDINITTIKGRKFTIDIIMVDAVNYSSKVTITDRVTNPASSWVYNTQPKSSSAIDNFTASIELIQNYINSVSSDDIITEIHNPCNCPFISEIDQNTSLSGMDIKIKVRVN